MIIRPPASSSPKYQRLPFTHNAVQAFLSAKEPFAHPFSKVKPLSKFSDLQFLKNKLSNDNIHSHSNSINVLKHHQHNHSVKAEISDKYMLKKVVSLGQEELMTPNTKLNEVLSSQKAKTNNSSSPHTHVRPYTLTTDFKSQESTSQKLHHPTSSMNYSTLQQQISRLIKKTECLDVSGQKVNVEHFKSRSVVESKENDYSLANQRRGVVVASPKTQPMRCVHVEKKAKYINTSDGSYCCTDCALKLANLGFKVQEVSASTSPPKSNNEQHHKESQMRSYLAQLESSHHQRDKLPDILKQQLQEIKQYYEGQSYQCESVYCKLMGCLQQCYQSTQQEIATQMSKSIQLIQQMYQELQESVADTHQIQKDIQNNWRGIVEGIDIGPFTEIMSQYSGKFHNTSKQIDEVMSKHIVMVSLPPADTPLINKQIADSFKLIYQTIPLIPQEHKPVRTQPTPKKIQQSTPKINRVKTCEKEESANFFQYFFESTTNQPIMSESVETCRASNSIQNQVYISFENRDIFHSAIVESQQIKVEPDNAIMVLQSYRGSQQHSDDDEKSCHSTPHSPASGNPKTIYERVKTTTEDPPKQTTFRTLFQPDDTYKPTSNSVSPSTSDKFKSFLDKVNNNQSKTQQFYQQFIHTKSSPRYEDELSQQQQQQQFSPLKSKRREISVPSESSQSSDQRVEPIDPFQKALFCSPTFKNDC